MAFDITLLDEQGNEIQPTGEVTVSFSNVEFVDANDEVLVYHFEPQEENAPKGKLASSPHKGKKIAGGFKISNKLARLYGKKVTFNTEHFSIYIVGTNIKHDNSQNRYIMNIGDTLTIEERDLSSGGTWSITKGDSLATLAVDSSNKCTITAVATGNVTVRYRKSWWISNTDTFFYIQIALLDSHDTLTPAVVTPGNENAGEVTASKTAKWIDEENRIAEIEFSVKGVPLTSASDVILVMDVSGSMSDRIVTAKRASNEFIDELLGNDNPANNRVAFIPFSHGSEKGGASDTEVAAATKGSLNFSYDIDLLKKHVRSTEANGGTNYTAALQKAINYAASRYEDEQTRPLYVVFMSDGAPGLSGESPNDPNWNGTVQADTLRGSAYNATIYTVGIQLADGSSGVSALKNISSSDSNGEELYKSVSNMTDLEPILQTIAGQIVNAGTDAVIKDVISEYFEYYNTAPYTSDAIYNPADKSVTITVGDITDQARTYKIYAQLLPEYSNRNGWYPTNNGVLLTYTDINGQGAENEDLGDPVVEVVANTDTAYKVTHYREDLNADTYTLAETDDMTGTTGAQTEAAAKSYEGFTAQSFNQVSIAADGSTVVDIYYSRNSYALTYAITGDNFANAAYATATYEYGEAVTAVATPSQTGYTFIGWTGVPETMPADNVTASGYYTANTDTAYKVTHYREDLNADTYTLAETDDMTGTTGAQTEAAAKSYEGFTAQSFNQVSIAADGSTVVDIYYSRNSYALTYAITGDNFANAAYATATYEYGEAVTAVATPSQTGYTFIGWTGVPETMPADNVTASGYYTANTDTAYKVTHYREDLNADTYTLAETDDMTGTTGAQTEAAAKSYEGFTAQSFNQVSIAADGSTVVDIYYSRNSYALTYAITGDNFANAAYATATYEYGEAVTAVATPSQTGYTFIGWTGVPETMPADNVTASGYYTANTDTAYKVTHYREDLNADTYTLAETDDMTGTTGAQTEAAAKSYEGFTAQSFNQVSIAADGSTVVDIYYSRNSYALTYAITGDNFANAAYATATYEYGEAVTAVATPSQTGYTFIGWTGVPETMPADNVTASGYYTANTDTAYKVTHYREDLNADTYTLAETDDMTGTTGAQTEAAAKSYEGFTAQSFNQVSIAADGSTVVDIYYSRNSYALTYAITGDNFANAAYATATYEYGEAVTAVATPSQTGYTFIGWTGVPETMPADNVTASGYYTANTDTAYKVTHYREDLNADTYTLAETDDMTGTTGAQTEAAAKSYEGFTAQSFNQVSIAADGSTVVDIYYSRNSYALTYAITGDNFANAAYATATYEYGEAVTAVATPSQTGYTFIGWTGVPETMPADNVTASGYYTANTDTAYKVTHYREDLNADTYTLAETDDMTGTTGAQTEAAAKSYEGFTAQSFNQVSIAADGSTVVDIYYSRNSYALTYAITGDNFANAAYATATYEYGEAVTAVATPSQTGYTFIGWTGVPETMPADNVTASGYYTANTDTAYKVTHYREDLNADTYTLAETDDMTGTTGAQTEAAAKSYEGFTAQSFNQVSIAADGSTVVDIYYSRNSYALTYAITGDNFANAAYATATYEYGEAVTAVATPSQTGYTFIGWTGVPETMPADNVTASGYYTANTDTAYKVTHYREDLNADTYTLAETDDMTGTTGAQTEAAAKSYEGFTAQSFNQVSIAADGSTVVDIYYSRNSYALTYAITGDNFANAAYATATYEYGEAVTAVATPSQTGYTFIGWTGVPETMPADNVTASGYYTANTDTAYKVTHYREDLNADTYTLAETDDMTGTTGAQTEAAAKSYEGFTAQSFNQVSIAADGSTVVDIYYSRNSYALTYAITGDNFANAAYATATYEYGEAVTAVATPSQTGYTFIGWTGVPETMPADNVTASGYYTANTDTAYKVTHYREDLNADTYTLAETDDMTGTTGAQTEAAAKSYEGFTAQSFNQVSIAADGSTVVDIYYSRNSYALTYAITGDNFANAAYATATYEYGEAVTAVATPSQTGYTFIGWTGVPETMPADNVTASGYYTANTDTAYKVTHYREDLNADTYTLAETDDMTGTTGAQTEAAAKSYEGFTAQSFNQVSIAADGSTVVDIYYSRNSYALTYAITGDNFANAAYATATYEYGEAVTAVATPSQTGYTFIGWTGVPETMPADNVTASGYYTANTDTAYKVTHYREDLNADTYTLAETDDMTGTTGAQTEAAAKSYEGFTAQSFNQVSIAADGSTVVDIYYSRNSYALTYAITGDNFANAAYATATYEYGEAVTAVATPSQTGYTFIGWTGVPETMPADNVTASGYYEKDPSQWHKVSFTAGVNGSLKAEDQTVFEDILTGNIWSEVITVPTPIANSGYKFNGWSPALPESNDQIIEDKTFIATFTTTGGGGSPGGGSPGGGGPTTNPTTPPETSEIVVEPEAPLVSLNKEDHYAYMVGYPDNTFRPEGKVTREEVATVFYKLLDEQSRTSMTTKANKFSDLEVDRWSCTPISTLAVSNIITGYEDGTFRPGNVITRAELATIASKFDNLSPFESNKFSDVAGHWANTFINSAAQKGWVNGYEDGTFKPEQAITRAEFATLVNNVLDRRVKKENILPDAKQFSDLNANAWYYEACQEAINSHYYERENPSDFEVWTELYEFTISW